MKQVFRGHRSTRPRASCSTSPSPTSGRTKCSSKPLLADQLGHRVTTLSKTPPELAKQTLSDPWMRNVVKQTVFATG